MKIRLKVGRDVKSLVHRHVEKNGFSACLKPLSANLKNIVKSLKQMNAVKAVSFSLVSKYCL